MNIEDKIVEIVKENAGIMMHAKGYEVLTLDPQDLKDLTKSLVKNLGLLSISQQRELLILGFSWVSTIGEEFFNPNKTVEDMVDSFLAKINSD